MDFDFSDDQEQLREAVRRWVEKAYTFDKRRTITQSGGFSPVTYNELAELGLCGLLISEEQGGMGMGPVEAMVVMEELGRGLVMEPLAQTLMVSQALAHAPTQLQSQWLPRVASGEVLVGLALQERASRYHLHQVSATAHQSGDQWLLSGQKHLVAAGTHAAAFVVSAQVAGAVGLFLVDANQAAVLCRGYLTQDGAASADVQFNDAVAHLITVDGLSAVQQVVDVGIAALCAEGVGAMDKVMEITVDYLNTRKQFGVAIGSFQALRHRVADLKMQLELARSMSYYATLKLGAPADERRAAMARAKYQLGCSMRLIGQESVQMHGGIGMTDEYIISHYFKRLTQMEMTLGDRLHHLAEVSARMQDTAGVFA